jgi:predicted phosphate transport protein (TIGR00153 family)
MRFPGLQRIIETEEEGVLRSISSYKDLWIRSIEVLREELTAQPDRVDSLNQEMSALEKAGDERTVEIKEKVDSGAIAPSLLVDMNRLVDKCDDVLDKAHYLSREIRRYAHARASINGGVTPEIEGEAVKSFEHMLALAKEGIELLVSMLSSKRFSELSQYRKKIEQIEEEVDEVKDRLLDSLYRYSTSVPYIVFEHLSTVVHKIDDIVDASEDIADVVVTVSASVVK